MNKNRIHTVALLLAMHLTFVLPGSAQGVDARIYFSTFLGGNSHEWIDDICFDDAGNMYAAGTAYSRDFPVTKGKLQDRHAGGESDVFIAKFDPAGGCVFSTFLGGSGYDGDAQIELDRSGNIVVAGATLSMDFPVSNKTFDGTHNGHIDIFITKINPACDSIIFSTYLGGKDQDHHPMLALDDQANIYITGPTRSPDFGGGDEKFVYRDAFFFKLNPEGSELLYGMFLGGKGDDNVFKLAVGRDGAVGVGGVTTSLDFPATASAFDKTYNGERDVFLLKIKP